MSRFYGSLRGSAENEVTRQGDVNSGMLAHVRGCDCGIMVTVGTDELDRDTFNVEVTGGSNGDGASVDLFTVKLNKDGTRTFQFNRDLIIALLEE